MRYRLRTIIVLAAIPLLGAAAWYVMAKDRVTISSWSTDDSIRRTLLEHTPVGSSPRTVIAFIHDSLSPKGHIEADSVYLDDYENATGKKIKAVPWTRKRFIRAVVAERPRGFLVTEEVTAKWHFDQNDRLTDISIDRHGLGP